MEIVINIPKRYYNSLKQMRKDGLGFYHQAILNGTILPEGHGDLIDRKKLINDGINKGFCDWYDEIKYAEPIIKADREDN